VRHWQKSSDISLRMPSDATIATRAYQSRACGTFDPQMQALAADSSRKLAFTFIHGLSAALPTRSSAISKI
jgi:hypothetical protein